MSLCSLGLMVVLPVSAHGWRALLVSGLFHRVRPTCTHSFRRSGVIESPAHGLCCRATQRLASMQRLRPAPFLGGSASHIQTKVHPGNHQVGLQEAKLHVLSSNDGASVVGVGIHAKFVFHLRMETVHSSLTTAALSFTGGVNMPVTLFCFVSRSLKRVEASLYCTNISKSGFDGNLHETGCPAALEPTTAIARIIVRRNVQYVFTGFAELDVRRCFSAKACDRITARQRINSRPRFIKRH